MKNSDDRANQTQIHTTHIHECDIVNVKVLWICSFQCISISDQSNFTVDPEEEIQQCMYNKEIWGHLIRSMNENALSIVSQSNSSVLQHDSKTALLKEDNALSFCCLSHAVDWIVHKKNIDCLSCSKNNTFLRLLNEAYHIQILVTGSLHLVGGVLALVDS